MIRSILLIAVCCLGPVFCRAANEDQLQQGFNDMYNLSFDSAHTRFQEWAKTHPDDPRAPAFDAAAYLFAEFHRLRILQSELFVDDRTFSDRKVAAPDPTVKQKFEAALSKSDQLAQAALRRNPKDRNALLANLLRVGLNSDYLSLIEKRNLAALGEVKQGRKIAEELLSLYPDCYDAYLAIGVENYLLSLKSAPVRWVLQMAGAQTDKKLGIEKLRMTAAKGHYLQPYAQLLLAVAALRDKDSGQARHLLSDLASRFPRNELYREELSKIQ
jgi:hypothetical protein